jgi:uncharacterized protein (TIGR00251 family)
VRQPRAAQGGARATGAEALLAVKVVPGGSRDAVVGMTGDRLRVKVAAPPEGGRANRAVLDLLAARLGVPRADLRIVRGETSARKTIAVRGLSTEAAVATLLRDAPG